MKKIGYAKNVAEAVASIAERAAGVPAVHSPSPSAGEKMIYRYTPGKYDGEYETVTVTVRFISRNIGDAIERAETVSLALCSLEGRGELGVGDSPAQVQRRHSGGSGYIGRTGHYFVLAAFEVRRHLPSDLSEDHGKDVIL